MPHESDLTAGPPRPSPEPEAPTVTGTASPRSSPGSRDPHTLPAGAAFGHYRIESVLGAGGMGVVYRARQDRPAREVALKVIRPGFASAQALRRFELEAEVLGRLQHPGIAQVYEAGTSKEDQPFFAMELVQGEPLTRYADSKQLTTRQRLELFAKVCDAVQHAHTKGVIHRDLKPGNILVDASGQPRILDFGVARLTQHDVQAVTIQTDIGQLIGTVPYMSPEQVEGDPANLDTRSDVYALGVILYELLAGRLPYDLSKKLIHEAARIIKEDEPTRLSSINRTLRGDIETIALKALEKNKARRYQAASDLGSDITRFLRSEPIVARPASRSYQLRKFAQRNKALVGGVAAAFVLLAAGLAGTSYGLVRAEEQRKAAETNAQRALAEAQRAEEQRAEAIQAREAESAQRRMAEQRQREAQIERARAEAVNRFLNNDLLGSIDPDRARRRDITVREVVDAAASRVAGAFDDEPEVEMRVRQSIGGTYERLGAMDACREQLLMALHLAEALSGPSSEPVAEIAETLARSYRLSPNVAEALAYSDRALEIRERINGPDDPRTLIARGDVSAYRAQLRNELAAGLDSMTLRMISGIRQRGESETEVATHVRTITAEVTRLWIEGQHDSAVALVRAECEPAFVIGLLRDRVPLGLGGYALRLFQEGNLAGAEAVAVAADQIASERFDPSHSSRLFARYVLGTILGVQDRNEESVAILEPTYALACASLGEESDLLEMPRLNFAMALLAVGRLEDARSMGRRAFEARARKGIADTARTRDLRGIMGDAALDLGLVAEAEGAILPLHERIVKDLDSAGVTFLPSSVAESYRRMIRLRLAQGREIEAESLACEALECLSRFPDDGQLQTHTIKIQLAEILLDCGRADEALIALSGALERSVARFGRGHNFTLLAASVLFKAYTALGDSERARGLVDQFGRRIMGTN